MVPGRSVATVAPCPRAAIPSSETAAKWSADVALKRGREFRRLRRTVSSSAWSLISIPASRAAVRMARLSGAVYTPVSQNTSANRAKLLLSHRRNHLVDNGACTYASRDAADSRCSSGISCAPRNVGDRSRMGKDAFETCDHAQRLELCPRATDRTPTFTSTVCVVPKDAESRSGDARASSNKHVFRAACEGQRTDE